MSERRQKILGTVEGLVSGLMYYDRRGDEDLPRGAIEAAVEAGEITYQEMGEHFLAKLKETME